MILGCFTVYFGISRSYAKLDSPFVEKFAWKTLDFEFEEKWIGEVAQSQKVFQPENNLPVGIEIWHDKLFVTVPRWKEGVPSTLNYVSIDSSDLSPKLIPYPDWASNKQGDCDSITTTYRVRVDSCDRLWVLDSGSIGLGNTSKQLCPFALHIFDLTTNTRLRKYNLNVGDTNANSFIPNIIIDEGDSCEDTFMYAADALGYGLIVYSWQRNDSWRFEHGFFMPDPLAGDFTVSGVNYQWSNEGIFGLALSPQNSNGSKTVFFHPLASFRDFYVSTEILKNKTKVNDSYKDFHLLPSRGVGGHVSTHVMDEFGVLFYNLVDDNAIACWDSSKPYRKENLLTVARDDEKLVFPSDVRIDNSHIWIMSDRMPVHIFSKLNYTDYNFRVLYSALDQIVPGSVCDPSIPEYRLSPTWEQGLYL